MPIQPTNAKTVSAWERMVASVHTTMRMRPAPVHSPETSELSDGSSSREGNPDSPHDTGDSGKPVPINLEQEQKARAIRDYVFNRGSAIHDQPIVSSSRSSMTGPLLLSLVFIAASMVFFVMSSIWRHQDPLLGGGFIALACLCGVIGAIVAVLAVVGILGDK